MKAVLVYSNDDGFSLGVELLRASVGRLTDPALIQHRVWFHEPLGSLTDDYLGHYTPFLARLCAFNPDVISFSVFVWNVDEFGRLARMVRRHLPNCVIVWGGGQVNSRRMADTLLNAHSWLDYVIRGEAEESYPAFLTTLAEGGDPAGVPGLSMRSAGAVCHTPDPPDVKLAELPDVFTPENLPLGPIFERFSKATLAYETGRGCRQKCRFCLYAVSKLRTFAMDRIERELTYLLEAGIPALRICDAHLGTSRPRAMEIFEIIAAHNRRTVVDVYPDTKHVDLEYVRAMNRAGCRVVSLGIQSSDPGALQIAGRRFDEERFGNAARLIRRHHNHLLAADVIVGLPGDDYAKVKESIRFAYRSGIESVHFAPLMAFPGTDFYEYAEEYELEFFDFAPPLVISAKSFSDAEYRQAIVLARRVEVLQQEAPMLLRTMLAAGADPVEPAESVEFDHGDIESLDEDALLAWLRDAHPQPLAAILSQALAWDRAVREQRHRPPRQVPALDEDLRVVAVDRAAVAWFDLPLHRLARDHELTLADLPRGGHGYLLPTGGSAVYELTGVLKTAHDLAEPGVAVGQWCRAITAASPGTPATVAMEAIRLLCLCGVAVLGVADLLEIGSDEVSCPERSRRAEGNSE